MAVGVPPSIDDLVDRTRVVVEDVAAVGREARVCTTGRRQLRLAQTVRGHDPHLTTRLVGDQVAVGRPAGTLRVGRRRKGGQARPVRPDETDARAVEGDEAVGGRRRRHVADRAVVDRAVDADREVIARVEHEVPRIEVAQREDHLGARELHEVESDAVTRDAGPPGTGDIEQVEVAVGVVEPAEAAGADRRRIREPGSRHRHHRLIDGAAERHPRDRRGRRPELVDRAVSLVGDVEAAGEEGRALRAVEAVGEERRGIGGHRGSVDASSHAGKDADRVEADHVEVARRRVERETRGVLDRGNGGQCPRGDDLAEDRRRPGGVDRDDLRRAVADVDVAARVERDRVPLTEAAEELLRGVSCEGLTEE